MRRRTLRRDHDNPLVTPPQGQRHLGSRHGRERKSKYTQVSYLDQWTCARDRAETDEHVDDSGDLRRRYRREGKSNHMSS
jgi:hypothetical protein